MADVSITIEDDFGVLDDRVVEDVTTYWEALDSESGRKLLRDQLDGRDGGVVKITIEEQ